MSTPQKSLKTEAQKYLVLADLFPKGKPDLRTKLNKYQVGKINKALAIVKNLGGEHAGQIVPMGRGRKKYMTENELPLYMRGIFLSGGKKVNKKLQYIEGEIKYERGGSPRSRAELDTSGTDIELLASADRILKRRNHRNAAITANGRVIGLAQNLRSNDLIKKEAAYIFNKYVVMSDNGEMRTHNGGQVKAAHPAIWGMGILFEKPQGAKNGKHSGSGKSVKNSTGKNATGGKRTKTSTSGKHKNR